MDKIRKYRNTIVVSFENSGSNFSLKVPHYKKWLSLIKFLKARGIDISENPSYKEHYSVLSKYHKIGFKRNVALLMEIGSSRIELQFGNIQNLWKGIAQSFWDDPFDNRYTKLNYLEQIAVDLEIKKTMDFCMKWGLEMQEEDSNLPPERYIIKNLNENQHIHGKVEKLEDIRRSIESGVGKYNGGYNSDDKNDKKIICGEKKYFYEYGTRRLSVGVVWHNINNMWWVISGNRLRNVCAKDLFDFDPELNRRKPADENYLEKLLIKYQFVRNYKKCMEIQDHINKTFQKLA